MYDLIVIGAGPGGYVAAIRAAQLGKSVVVVEREAPGGVCLNWGCIPSKNLIHQAECFQALRDMEAVGVSVDRTTLDYAAVQAKSREVVKTLTGGVAGLLKRNGVEFLTGTATIVSPREVTLQNAQGSRRLTGENILVATGSRALEVPGFEFDEQIVLSSKGILAMTRLPKSLVILGAGAIGCEFAYVMNSFGVRVTLVEALGHILPTEDAETCAVLDTCFRQSGIDVRVRTRAKDLVRGEESVTVTLEDMDGGSQRITADKALVVFGRVPNTGNLGLDAVGVKLDARGYVEVGDFGQTSVPGIYAIGDVTATPALAHVASAEGEIVAEHLAGEEITRRALDPETVPSAVYCEPQLAGFGLREERALAENIPFEKSVFHYPGAGKSIAIGKAEGLVKLLCDPRTGELLGAHIVGHNGLKRLPESAVIGHGRQLEAGAVLQGLKGGLP